jgi:hypothetical protein
LQGILFKSVRLQHNGGELETKKITTSSLLDVNASELNPNLA